VTLDDSGKGKVIPSEKLIEQLAVGWGLYRARSTEGSHRMPETEISGADSLKSTQTAKE
jgi:hypothetical protein